MWLHRKTRQTTMNPPAQADPSSASFDSDQAPVFAHMAVSEPELLARFFRVLGDPTRVRIIQLLLEAPTGECTVGELVTAVSAPQSRVSTHLGCLRWCGLVQTRRAGKQVYYRVSDPRVREVLNVGGRLLRDYAAGVASCGVNR
jgi:DNA-binding transcriptional ArsR family regulator